MKVLIPNTIGLLPYWHRTFTVLDYLRNLDAKGINIQYKKLFL
jgi:hypothetical protein